MKQTPKYVKEVQELLAQLDNDGYSQDKQPFVTNTPEQETDVYIEEYEEEQRITLIRKKPYGMPVTRQEDEESELSDLDTAPLTTKPTPQPVTNAFIGALLLGLLVPLFCIALQLYFIANPFTVTVTLAAKTQHLSLTGTLQLGRALNPITLSQSQSVQTTGHGHQDARNAIGSITFYNGQPAQEFVPAGAILTSANGIHIATNQDATIPAADLTANPPVFGQVTVAAQATIVGSGGNIAAYDINETCCAPSVVAKNTQNFSGGQDARDFQTVTKQDIANAATPLKTTLVQSMQNTLTGQLKSGEALTSHHCSQTTTADHQAGEEASQVKVTVSETCSSIAYDTQALETKVTALLTAQAIKKLGTGYSILESPQITVTQATAAKQVMLSFTSVSRWIYALNSQEQNHMKKIIAGKTKEQALQRLYRLPGIEQVSMQFAGFGDDTSIPKNLSSIHLTIIYGM